ncbi:MAG TPA: STAS domain-containing protein [Candidatus Acidoferrales bacterium]|nr:STAS domain-containing protein [Candidatus Acidoferrales bacterium]
MTAVLVFAGDYDVAAKNDLRADFDRLAAEPNVVFDLSAVGYVDSGFLGELRRLHEHRARAGLAPLTLIVPKDSRLRRLLGRTSLANLFRIVDDLAEPA